MSASNSKEKEKVPIDKKLILTMAEAAQMINVSLAQIYVIAKRENWPVKSIGGKGKTISRKWLDSWVDQKFSTIEDDVA